MSFTTNNENLTIDLFSINPELKRATNHAPSRERVTGEKYFTQAIYVYNKEGKLVDSGFIQINDYTNMCKMVRICNKFKKTYHIFEKWEHYGKSFYKTNKFSVKDLVTGNIVGEVLDIYIENYVKISNTTIGDSCYIVGDFEKDEYSEVLLECLNEYSNLNMPLSNRIQKNKFEEDYCHNCNLFEKLDIQESFKNGEISEEIRDLLIDRLLCTCNKSLDQDLTEKQKIIRAELKLKAKEEIEEVLFIKETDSEIANMV